MKKVYTLLLMAALSLQVAMAGAPDKSATAPTLDASKVISLFSDEYTDVAVTTWRTSWSSADLKDTMIGSDNVKKYSNLDFVGIESTGSDLVDASSMMYVHVDVWMSKGNQLRLKLVDFGADMAFGGGDDTEHEIVWNNVATDEWVSYHIPFSNFSNLANRDNLAQYIFAAAPAGEGEIYVDNFYFTTEGESEPLAEPTVGAADPTDDAANVISLFSDSYTDETVDTWRTDWSAATLEDVVIDGNNVKKYSALDFVGIEATGANSLDLTEMEYVHFDMWSPNATTFRIKLVDFGADNAFGGGDDTEDTYAIENPTNEMWVNQKIALSEFVGMTNKDHVSQIIFSAVPESQAVVYLDNIYFSKAGSTQSVVNTNAGRVNVFPVPANNVINIEATDGSTVEQVSVLNVNGQLVYAKNKVGSTSEVIKTADWNNGVYFIQLTTSTGTQIHRITVQH